MSNNRTGKALRLARMFKALSNPHRLSIFMKLASSRKRSISCGSDGICACVGELGRNLGIVPSTVSHHIRELNRAGLIQLSRRGQNVVCSIDSKTLEELRFFFAAHEGEQP